MAHAWEPHPGRWPVVAAMLGVVALTGVLLRPGAGGDAGEPLIIQADVPPTTPAPTPAPTAAPLEALPAERLPEAPGTWTRLPDAPIGVPGSHRGVWTGTELIVGFQPAVAAYDPEAGIWRELPALPGAERVDARVVWTGQHVAVFGGYEPNSAAPARADGMLLDLAGRAWEPIPPAPDAPLWDPTVVWTGEELVVWGGARPGDDEGRDRWPVRGSAFDPEARRWRELPPPPVERVYRTDGVWTGREVLLWGSHRPRELQLTTQPGPPFAVAYDPVADTWRALPAPPLDDPAGAAAVWTGEVVVLWGRPAYGSDPAARLAGSGALVGLWLDPARVDRGWRELRPIDASGDPPTSLYGFASTSAGRVAVVYGGYPRSVGLAYDPASNLWRRLPAHTARVNALAAWTGRELLLWGGYTPTGPRVDLWAFRPGVQPPASR